MKSRIKICCLPVSSINDPYQSLMMEGLRTDSEIEVSHGIDNKFFGVLLTALFKSPNYIHFDWNYRYFFRKQKWLTWLSIPLFISQLYFVKYIMGIKIVWSMHNIQSHDNIQQRKEEKWVQRRFAHICSWIRLFSYSSVSRASEYLAIAEDKFRVSYHASFFGCYPNETSKSQARALLNLNPEDVILLHFGSIRPYKGLELLIDAFKKLPNDNVKLIVAGKPYKAEYLPNVNKLVSEDKRIIPFIGFIEDDKVQYFFNSADIVVLPYTDIENSGPALMAMMFAKPVVAPELGFLQERLSKQQELLYTSGNLEVALKDAIFLSKDKLSMLGKANYEDIRKSNWNHFTQFFK